MFWDALSVLDFSPAVYSQQHIFPLQILVTVKKSPKGTAIQRSKLFTVPVHRMPQNEGFHQTTRPFCQGIAPPL